LGVALGPAGATGEGRQREVRACKRIAVPKHIFDACRGRDVEGEGQALTMDRAAGAPPLGAYLADGRGQRVDRATSRTAGIFGGTTERERAALSHIPGCIRKHGDRQGPSKGESWSRARVGFYGTLSG
jgi:hypothetical protein